MKITIECETTRKGLDILRTIPVQYLTVGDTGRVVARNGDTALWTFCGLEELPVIEVHKLLTPPS